MPWYRNIAPRVVGVTKGREVVLVPPKETVECTEDEAAGHVRKGALEKISESEAQQQGSTADASQGNYSELAGQSINAPATSPTTTTRTSYRTRAERTQRDGEESKE